MCTKKYVTTYQEGNGDKKVKMKSLLLLKRAKSAPFDDDLIDEIVTNKDDEVTLLALARSDCPPVLLVDLSQSKNDEVRLAVLHHPNTPERTRKRMKKKLAR